PSGQPCATCGRTLRAAGAISTSRLPSRAARLPARRRPAAPTLSIQGSSAERKRSAGAPAMICRARADEAAKESTGRACPSAAQASATSLKDSWRLAAASTNGPRSAALTAGARKSAARKRPRERTNAISSQLYQSAAALRKRGGDTDAAIARLDQPARSELAKR